MGVELKDLEPNTRYVFVVTVLDEHGAYDPVFSSQRNILRFTVAWHDYTGPALHMFNESFSYTYPVGDPSVDRTTLVPVTFAAPGPTVVHWSATPVVQSNVEYRFVLDPSVELEFAPWSRWSATTTSANLGPFANVGPYVAHRLYIEARDGSGNTSIGGIRFTVIPASFHRDLLIVDDTRLFEDRSARNPSNPDSVLAPLGAWPTAAELDTFLYARGGARWRSTPISTPPTTPGVFAGYDFDTAGTRVGLEDPLSAFPLELLARYRHIIWIIDGTSSLYRQGEIGGGPGSAVQPQTLLRYMTDPNRQNRLATYIKMGGKVWLLGGGAGNATIATWNNRTNDIGRRLYTSFGERPELVPSRFMYDLVHWRSEFQPAFDASPVIERSVHAGGPGSGSYGRLPERLEPKAPATDPLPPLRSGGSFYTTRTDVEFLTAPNHIADPRNPSPRHAMDIQALDTLYVARGGGIPVRPPSPDDAGLNPCMTYYHGIDNTPVVFSGFNIWSWKRAQCVQLVDAVLQDLWGLTRSGGGPGAPVSTRREQ